eukprot:scaffold47249_cov16-Tisochrysis_lutea.AAC.1
MLSFRWSQKKLHRDVSKERIRLGAELEDGTIIKGQNQISHPSVVGASVCTDSYGPSPSAKAGAVFQAPASCNRGT